MFFILYFPISLNLSSYFSFTFITFPSFHPFFPLPSAGIPLPKAANYFRTFPTYCTCHRKNVNSLRKRPMLSVLAPACRVGGWGRSRGCQSPAPGHGDTRPPRQKRSTTSPPAPVDGNLITRNHPVFVWITRRCSYWVPMLLFYIVNHQPL